MCSTKSIDQSTRIYIESLFGFKWVNKILQWWNSHEPIERPTWDEYFMMMAMLAATRSVDAQWQAGAVLVKNNRIISTGYNSFPTGMPDELLPNTRPDKYNWVIHSEANALYNATQDVRGSTCYTNGHPCLECLKACYQSGVKDFVITQGKAHMVHNIEEDKLAVYDSLISAGGIKIREINVSKVALNRLTEIFSNSN